MTRKYTSWRWAVLVAAIGPWMLGITAAEQAATMPGGASGAAGVLALASALLVALASR